MAKYTPVPLSTTLSNSAATLINNNLAAISEALENTLSRDGDTPNQLTSDLDLNNNDLLNADQLHTEELFVNGTKVVAGEAVNADNFATAAQGAKADTALQPSDIDVTVQRRTLSLQSISDLVTSSDKMLYTTGVNTWALSTITPFTRLILDDVDGQAVLTTLGVSTYAQTLLDDTSATAARSTLGVVIGTDVQAQDGTLQALAGVTTSADQLIYATGSDTFATTSLTSFSRTLLDDTTASAWRTTLELGTAATVNTGTSGSTIPLLNGANTWSATQTLETIVVGGGVVAGSLGSPIINFGGSIGMYRTSTSIRTVYSSTAIMDVVSTGINMATNMSISFAGTGAATTRTNLGLGSAAVLNALVGTATYDPPSLADGAGASTTVTVTGAALGDVALASFSLSTQGILVTANVTATDTVTVRFQNETTGVIDLASGTLKAVVLK